MHHEQLEHQGTMIPLCNSDKDKGLFEIPEDPYGWCKYVLWTNLDCIDEYAKSPNDRTEYNFKWE
jgi:hypothetical protein